MIDFVGVWKAVSLALTAAFGVLGLINDSKDKITNKLTRYGWISLTGIAVSGCFNVAAQIIDYYKFEISKASNEKQITTISQKLSEANIELARIKYPIKNINMIVEFSIRCLDKSNHLCSMTLIKNNTGKTWSNVDKTRKFSYLISMFRMDFYYKDNPFTCGIDASGCDEDLSYLLHSDIPTHKVLLNGGIQKHDSRSHSYISNDLENKHRALFTVEAKGLTPYSRSNKLYSIADLADVDLIIFGVTDRINLKRLILSDDYMQEFEYDVKGCQLLLISDKQWSKFSYTRRLVYGDWAIHCRH